jgi:2-polyprenyl-3-methyl-5-hydroxy-6-metoxy-1,4-benzoquinol methylase
MRSEIMKFDMPSSDDRGIWDLFLSPLWLPAVTAADETGMFASLAERPATASELAQTLDLNGRAVGVVLPMLDSLGLTRSRQGRHFLTDVARHYLVPTSPFYWGGAFYLSRTNGPYHQIVVDLLRKRTESILAEDYDSPLQTWHAEAWEQGQINPEQARIMAGVMHSHSLPSAVGLARWLDLRGVQRLLDVGGGSGCFSIALAQSNPALRCTVMDLPAMCAIADEHVRAAGLSDRVETQAVDMFRHEWPGGHDAVFFSNVFHDWQIEVCVQLAKRAHAALPPGGRIFVHEMLVDEGAAGLRSPAAFSLLMLVASGGQGFTATDLRSILERAGFADFEVAESASHFSLVSGVKR